MQQNQLHRTTNVRLIALFVVALIPLTAAVADTITYIDREYNGTGSWYTWHYRYNREDTLIPGESTWRLSDTYGVASGSGCQYWSDTATVGPGGKWIEWTYVGGEEAPQAASYSTFDVVADAAIGTVTYEADTDGDGGADYNGNVTGPVPEPGTIIMTAIGLATLAWYMTTRKSVV